MVRRRVLSPMLVGLALCVISSAGGVSAADGDAAEARAGHPPLYPSQGWTKSRIGQFYHAPEGTFLMPLAWSKALAKQAGKSSMYEMVKAYGALEDAESRDGLPVGMVIDRRFATEWLGVTCAMCHTGELRVGERRLRVVGGSSPVDYPSLLSEVFGRLVKVAEDPKLFDSFATDVGAEDRDALKKDVASIADRARIFLGILAKPEVVPTAYGPYRLDALGLGAINTAIARPEQVAQQPPPAQPQAPRANAPVSYPSLWHAPWRDSNQYVVAIHSPLPRNLIQAFATSFVPGPDPLPHRNLDFPALIRMEEWLRELQPPAWPEDLLGRVDVDKAARGGELYRDHCLRCHNWKTTLPNPEGVSFLETVETPPCELKSDPAQYEDFKGANRRMLLLQNISNQLMGAYFSEADLSPEARLSATFGKDNVWRVRAGYGATPLDGVWATAPYLHNGSVPTLYDLLLPPSKRPRTFRLGALAYDGRKVGLESDGPFTFDTTLPGNSNDGHYYGTELDDADRWALVEYLKVIRPWRWDDRYPAGFGKARAGEGYTAR